MSLGGVRFDPDLLPDVTLAEFEAAVQAAFDDWEAVANVEFRRVASEADADVSIAFEPLPGDTVGLATTFFQPRPGYDRVTSVDIDFDTSDTWSPYGERGELSLYAVALHEIGHGLGMEHVDDPTQIMNPFVGALDLGDGDIDGLQTLYGPRFVGTGGGDTLDATAETQSGQSLSGLGGNDVLDGSNRDDFLYGGAGNDQMFGHGGDDMIFDALGAGIAEGGAGDDMILGGLGGFTNADGGADDDLIVGGIGDDVISGGSGNDRLIGDPKDSIFFGNDTLIAGTGTDVLAGGAGADEFQFRPNEGTNTIQPLSYNATTDSFQVQSGTEFVAGLDQIALIGFGYGTFADDVLPNLTQVGGNVQFFDQNTTIILQSVNLADLTESDFIL